MFTLIPIVLVLALLLWARNGIALIIASIVAPLLYAINYAATLALALTVLLSGTCLYVLNAVFMRFFLARRASEFLADDTWELTAGTGTVPKWVSVLGLVGMGLLVAAPIIAAMAFFGRGS